MGHTAKLRRCLLNAYKKEVRKTAKWVEDNGCSLFTWEDANPDDVCIISKNDYELHEARKNCFSDNGSFFVTTEDYEKLFS
jgi:hypothetical protein